MFSDLSFGELIADIPHDGPAILVYLLLVFSAYLIWRGSRSGDKPTAPPSDAASREESPETAGKR